MCFVYKLTKIIRAPEMSVCEHLRCLYPSTRAYPSDADGGDDGDGYDGGVPTTLPVWLVPRGYHGQGSNIPFGESRTLIINWSPDFDVYYILQSLMVF